MAAIIDFREMTIADRRQGRLNGVQTALDALARANGLAKEVAKSTDDVALFYEASTGAAYELAVLEREADGSIRKTIMRPKA